MTPVNRLRHLLLRAELEAEQIDQLERTAESARVVTSVRVARAAVDVHALRPKTVRA